MEKYRETKKAKDTERETETEIERFENESGDQMTVTGVRVR